MALTDTAIRLAKAGESDRKLADEKGLYLFVTTTGSKLWRLKYRIGGKEKKARAGVLSRSQFEGCAGETRRSAQGGASGQRPGIGQAGGTNRATGRNRKHLCRDCRRIYRQAARPKGAPK